MESTIKESSHKSGFFKAFFTLTKEEKSESINLIQYTALAIIPFMILVRMNQLIWPTADEKSGTIELLAEVFGEVVFTGIIVFIIYRLIDFIPTYSGIPLKSINILSIITVFILTLPWYDNTSNLGTKIAILHKRIDARLPAFFGIQQDKTKVIKNNNNNNNELQVAQPTHKPSRADYLGAQNRLSIGNPPQSNQPNFDNMYQQNPPTPQLSNPAEAMQNMAPEPSAANETLGGAFGSSF